MKKPLALLVAFTGIVIVSGCMDSTLARRDDGRYALAAVPDANGRFPATPLPEKTPYVSDADGYSLVPIDSKATRERKAGQSKFVADLEKLDGQ